MPHKPALKSDNMPVFVSSSLTNERKPQLAAYAARNAEDIVQLISALTAEGYGFSCKAEDKDGFQASLRWSENCKNPANKGRVLVERAGSQERAILRLFWAHFELFELKWPEGNRAVDDDW